VFHNDGGASILSELDQETFPGIEEALSLYLDVIREVLVKLSELKEFKHVTLTETDTELQHQDAQSSLCLAVGTPQENADGEMEGVGNIRSPLDIQGLLTNQAEMLETLKELVSYDDEGVLSIKDTELAKQIDSIRKRVSMDKRFQDTLSQEQEQVLADALASLAPQPESEEEAVVPVHPEDVLTLLAVYLLRVAGVAAPGPNPFSQVRGLITSALGAARRRTRSLRKAVWQVEDIVKGSARFALGAAKKAVRPVLVGLVVHRALRTIEASRLPAVRLARMKPADQIEWYYSRLLGKDWKQQIEGDLLDAIKEVNDGYVTDDYRQEKRKLTAAMLRRLEVEEWDKERMKHFYYGSYGLGPWYFDMEERLHNPYFMGARAWNGPIEGWVGENKVYKDDIPAAQVDFEQAAFDMIEKQKGKQLNEEQRARIRAREQVEAVDGLLAKSSILSGVLDQDKVRKHVASSSQ